MPLYEGYTEPVFGVGSSRIAVYSGDHRSESEINIWLRSTLEQEHVQFVNIYFETRCLIIFVQYFWNEDPVTSLDIEGNLLLIGKIKDLEVNQDDEDHEGFNGVIELYNLSSDDPEAV